MRGAGQTGRENAEAGETKEEERQRQRRGDLLLDAPIQPADAQEPGSEDGQEKDDGHEDQIPVHPPESVDQLRAARQRRAGARSPA